MTWGIFSIGWLDLNEEAKASELFTRSYLPYVRQPFKVRIVSMPTCLHVTYFFSLFSKKILEDMSPFCGATDNQFWTSGDVSSGFQSQSGQPYSNFAEVYVLHIP